MVDYNAAASVASANTDIYHTSTADPTVPYHTITEDFLESDPESDELLQQHRGGGCACTGAR